MFLIVDGNIENIVTYLVSLNEEHPKPTRMYLLTGCIRIRTTANTNEIDTLERQYGIDLHMQWKTRLPDDFLVVDFAVCL